MKLDYPSINESSNANVIYQTGDRLYMRDAILQWKNSYMMELEIKITCLRTWARMPR